MKGFKRYIAFTLILMTLYLLYQYYKPIPLDWRPTYAAADKIPFGTYILDQQIKDLFPKVKKSTQSIYSTLTNPKNALSNYFIVAPRIGVNKSDFSAMVKYMNQGNNIFLAADELSKVLLDTLNLSGKYDFSISTSNPNSFNFTNPQLKSNQDYQFDKGIAEAYFDKLDTTRAMVLSLNKKNKAIFIRYKFGKGALFITLNPQLLTNYALLKPRGTDCASKMLSYLPDNQILIIDQYFTQKKEENSTQLLVIMNNPALKWAYYLMLFSLLLYVLFEMKRRQRIIPVIAPLDNTTVDFTRLVGRLYYQEKNNLDLAAKKINYFLAHIRAKYNIKTNVLDNDFKVALTNKSGAQENTIRSLLRVIDAIPKHGYLSDDSLIELNKIMEKFYKEDQ